MSRAGSALGLARLRYWGSPVEQWGDCSLSRSTLHLFSWKSARSGRRSWQPLPLAYLPRGGLLRVGRLL